MIAIAEFAKRRRQLMRMAGESGIVIVPAASERIRSNDSHFPYRQDSDFHYLTGFPEADAVLVLVPGRKQAETILFCREPDPEFEIWNGALIGPERAVSAYGFDDAFPISDIDDILPGLMEGRGGVHYQFGKDKDFDAKVLGWINMVRARVKLGAEAPHELIALGHLLHDLRLFKSPGEIRAMKRSAEIAAEAHLRVMRAARPGLNEAQIEAELLYAFHGNQAVPAYQPIVGSGDNACVLHYRANNAPLKDGDLLLVDAGAEYWGYASDITRTIPINGKFTPAQRAIYRIVLDAQLAAIAAATAGNSWNAPHEAAVETITRGLIAVGILQGALGKNVESGAYKRFFMHKTGHWLGLDVHDVGDYRIDGEFRELEPGMAMTVEPGIYIPANAKGVDKKWLGIGVRIEDDVVIGKHSPTVLSEQVPKDPDEIEALMAEARSSMR